MFQKNSRYADTPTVTVLDAEGREVTAVRLRRLPEAVGLEVRVRAGDRLDVIAAQLYRDPTGYWRVADANDALDARDLLLPIGRNVIVPEG